MSKIIAAVIGVVIFLASHAGNCGEGQPATSELQSLAQTWVGSSDNLSYFRLNLDASGKGQLAVEYDSSTSDFPIDLYRVTGTSFNPHGMSFTLVAIRVRPGRTRGSEKLSGSLQDNRLQLTWEGTDNGHVFWATRALLEPEDRAKHRADLLESAFAPGASQEAR